MVIDWNILVHASYVAFAFSVLNLGALAFRQVLDDLDVRRMRLGEDLAYFADPLGIALVLILLVLSALSSVLLYTVPAPSIFVYTFPLIILVHCVQAMLRVAMQRHQVKTHGVAVRRLVWGESIGIPINEISSIAVSYTGPIAEVTVYSNTSDPCTFRIFSFSAPKFLSLVHIQ